MTGVAVQLLRYPVKRLSRGSMESLALIYMHDVGHNRRFPTALETTAFEPAPLRSRAKIESLMPTRNEVLAGLQTRLDQDGRLLVRLGKRIVAEGLLDDAAARVTFGYFFRVFVSCAARGRVRVLPSPGHRFTAVSAPVPEFMDRVSLDNLASVRALRATMADAWTLCVSGPTSPSKACPLGRNPIKSARR